MTTAEAAQALQTRFNLAGAPREFRGELSVVVPVISIADVCRCAKEEFGFDYLLDITSIDHFETHPRFELVYELYSMGEGVHLRLNVHVEEDVEVPTVSAIWRTADWHEREIFDMMGIRFDAHPDLRRILMWEGYPFYPLRKDFPLEGKPSEMPDVAFSDAAPLEGGPFVTAPSSAAVQEREPRARPAP